MATITGPVYRYKHIMIVHGIGDQVPNETSLGFMNNFLRALPEGRGCKLDTDNLIESVDPPTISPGGPPARFSPAFAKFHSKAKGDFLIGFSEVYWQDITNGHLINGIPPVPIFVWAHSINTRLLQHGRTFHVVREVIDNLERLLGLARALSIIYKKSGELATILNRFLGDVQMYAESDVIRDTIDQRFADVATRVAQHEASLRERFQIRGSAEIYVVAHSEGTVVSYSTLVKAAIANLPWFSRVKGLVTLGCPIDKHYFIWHNRFQTKTYSGPALAERIPWFNYWDVSDPVGYGLSILQQEPHTDAGQLFRIRFDTPFIRYPIPGLAHVQYWTDRDLHRHIIRHVMDLDTPAPDHIEPLPNRWFGHGKIQDIVDLASYAVGRLATLAFGVYFLAHLLEPLPASWKPGWFHSSAVESAAITLAPLLLWLILWKMYAFYRGKTAALLLWLRRIVSGACLVLMVLFTLRLSVNYADTSPQGMEIKDFIGYFTGLVTTLLAWNLHTAVHKGIVQMWRYTKGVGTSARVEGAPEKELAAVR